MDALKSVPKSPAPARAKKMRKTTTPVRPKTEFSFHVVTSDEELPNGALLCQFCIPGRAATKKTHQTVIWVKGHPRIIPSKQYSAYEKQCKEACRKAWADQGNPPMDFGVSVQLRIVLDNWSVGDHTGYMQALGDILEAHGVIADDLWIHWSDAGEHWLSEQPDKENPRVEVTIRRMRHPKEVYRTEKEATELRAQARKAQKAVARLETTGAVPGGVVE